MGGVLWDPTVGDSLQTICKVTRRGKSRGCFPQSPGVLGHQARQDELADEGAVGKERATATPHRVPRGEPGGTRGGETGVVRRQVVFFVPVRAVDEKSQTRFQRRAKAQGDGTGEWDAAGDGSEKRPVGKGDARGADTGAASEVGWANLRE